MSEFIPSKTAEESQEDAAEIQASKRSRCSNCCR